MRGTELLDPRKRSIPRITPAHAGNSTQRRQSLLTNEDHPRACGEQRTYSQTMQRLRGSPPRMRGTGNITLFQHRAVGITPAHAGNRLKKAYTYALFTNQ